MMKSNLFKTCRATLQHGMLVLNLLCVHVKQQPLVVQQLRANVHPHPSYWVATHAYKLVTIFSHRVPSFTCSTRSCTTTNRVVHLVNVKGIILIQDGLQGAWIRTLKCVCVFIHFMVLCCWYCLFNRVALYWSVCVCVQENFLNWPWPVFHLR